MRVSGLAFTGVFIQSLPTSAADPAPMADQDDAPEQVALDLRA